MEKTEKLKVFLVDDDEMFVESLKHSLNGNIADILTFPTGEECLKNLKQEAPNVVVVDYYLNDKSKSAMNGIQVLNKIKEVNPETEVIMLSAQDNVSIAVDTLKYGAYDYIAKEQSAFVKVKNDIKHIGETLLRTDDYDQEIKRLRKINVLIVAAVIIIFILSRIL